MVNNMKNYNELSKQIKYIFKSSQIKYHEIKIEGTKQDSDLFFNIILPTDGKLKSLESISCLAYTSQIEGTLNLLITNIYSVKDTPDSPTLLDITNYMNLNHSIGTYLVYTQRGRRQIVYQYTIFCGEDFALLNAHMLNHHISVIMDSLNAMISLLKEKLAIQYEKTE